MILESSRWSYASITRIIKYYLRRKLIVQLITYTILNVKMFARIAHLSYNRHEDDKQITVV